MMLFMFLFLKSYLHFVHFPHVNIFEHNYSIDNILLTKKISLENKGSFKIFRMLIPERTEIISFFAPILQL